MTILNDEWNKIYHLLSGVRPGWNYVIISTIMEISVSYFVLYVCMYVCISTVYVSGLTPHIFVLIARLAKITEQFGPPILLSMQDRHNIIFLLISGGDRITGAPASCLSVLCERTQIGGHWCVRRGAREDPINQERNGLGETSRAHSICSTFPLLRPAQVNDTWERSSHV